MNSAEDQLLICYRERLRELHRVWKEKEYYKKWCYDESSGLGRLCTHFSHIFFTVLTVEENVTDPTCWQVMTDFTVLFLQCVVCNGMTNTAHHTHVPSTNNQGLDSQKLKFHTRSNVAFRASRISVFSQLASWLAAVPFYLTIQSVCLAFLGVAATQQDFWLNNNHLSMYKFTVLKCGGHMVFGADWGG